PPAGQPADDGGGGRRVHTPQDGPDDVAARDVRAAADGALPRHRIRDPAAPRDCDHRRARLGYAADAPRAADALCWLGTRTQRYETSLTKNIAAPITPTPSEPYQTRRACVRAATAPSAMATWMNATLFAK